MFTLQAPGRPQAVPHNPVAVTFRDQRPDSQGIGRFFARFVSSRFVGATLAVALTGRRKAVPLPRIVEKIRRVDGAS